MIIIDVHPDEKGQYIIVTTADGNSMRVASHKIKESKFNKDVAYGILLVDRLIKKIQDDK